MRPVRWLLYWYLLALGVSVGAYLFPPGVHGRDDFHARLGIALVASVLIGAVSVVCAPRRAQAIGSLVVCLGVVATPPVLLFALLAVACWGKADCLG